MTAGLQRRRGSRAGWKQGGVYVVANIRGGGEFGPQLAPGGAQGRTATRAYEDFAAVAEDLVAAQGHVAAASRHPWAAATAACSWATC